VEPAESDIWIVVVSDEKGIQPAAVMMGLGILARSWLRQNRLPVSARYQLPEGEGAEKHWQMIQNIG
jgi:hypothetical protein